MSPEAQSRAELWSGYGIADDQAAILARLKRDPRHILEAPRVEAGQLPANGPPPATQPARVTVPISDYRPNAVELAFDAPAGGLLVLKDVYAPGWEATLDGEPAPVVRVNGLVRGVFVPAAGRHVVRFAYRPPMFVYGAAISILTALLLGALTVVALRRHLASRRLPRPAPPGRADPQTALPHAT
jgi:hypothetical protein